MSKRPIEEPTKNPETGDESHPSWGLIGASRYSNSPGSVLFDSDITHNHTVRVSLSTASRKRDLNRDRKHGDREFLEVEMSEAQWASFVSSMGNGQGVPCTIRRREDEVFVPGQPPDSRMQESIDEVKSAASKAYGEIQEAFEAYAEKKNAANLKTLKYTIANAPANVKFAGDQLTEHAENVVQKAKFDIEAAVMQMAEQQGLDPGDVGVPQIAEHSEGEITDAEVVEDS